jgi:predicted RNase H-like nuclease (RuvC/YqgF family)
VSQWAWAAIPAIIAPAVAYLVAIRKTSGRIETTEAGQLWQEAEKLRTEYKEEIKSLRELVTSLRTRIEELAEDNRHLREENVALLRRVSTIEKNGG